MINNIMDYKPNEFMDEKEFNFFMLHHEELTSIFQDFNSCYGDDGNFMDTFGSELENFKKRHTELIDISQVFDFYMETRLTLKRMNDETMSYTDSYYPELRDIKNKVLSIEPDFSDGYEFHEDKLSYLIENKIQDELSSLYESNHKLTFTIKIMEAHYEQIDIEKIVKFLIYD